jgi:hypothetical protein
VLVRRPIQPELRQDLGKVGLHGPLGHTHPLETDGAPTGQLAWLGDDVLFARTTSDPSDVGGDGGLVRMGADGVDPIGPRWMVDHSSAAGGTPDSTCALNVPGSG